MIFVQKSFDFIHFLQFFQFIVALLGSIPNIKILFIIFVVYPYENFWKVFCQLGSSRLSFLRYQQQSRLLPIFRPCKTYKYKKPHRRLEQLRSRRIVLGNLRKEWRIPHLSSWGSNRPGLAPQLKHGPTTCSSSRTSRHSLIGCRGFSAEGFPRLQFPFSALWHWV